MGLTPSHRKEATGINLALQEVISMKKSLQRQLWGKNRDISAMLGANQNEVY